MKLKNAIAVYFILLGACYVLVSSVFMLLIRIRVQWVYEPEEGWERFWVYFRLRFYSAFIELFPVNLIIGFIISIIAFGLIYHVKRKKMMKTSVMH